MRPRPARRRLVAMRCGRAVLLLALSLLALGCGKRAALGQRGDGGDDAEGFGCVPESPGQCEVTVGGPSGGGDPCGPDETYMGWDSGDESSYSCARIPASCEGCCPTCDCMSSLCEPGQRCVVDHDVPVSGEPNTLLRCTDVGECPDPVVHCDEPPPACEFGTYAEADSCDSGSCVGRCWTGACLPCGDECRVDKTCILVGRQGCCGPSGDCQGCTWAAPAAVLGDECFFEQPTCPLPDPPSGCATTCTDDPLCGACPHCSPQAARCEGGYCVPTWPACEPECTCD